VTGTNNVQVADRPNTAAAYGALNVTTTPIELKVGASVLSYRTLVHIQPKGNGVYWGYDSAVGSTTGNQVFRNQLIFVPLGPGISIWLVSTRGSGVDVRIGELA
jgi:hypothetical protein